MYIIIAYLAFFGIIAIIISSSSKKQFFVIFAGITLVLISSLRSIQFGPDVSGYVTRYNSLNYTPISEIWMDFITGSTDSGKEPFFYLTAKLLNMLGVNHQIWLAVLSVFFCFAVFKLIYKYSNEPYMSIVVLISLGYLYFSYTGLRQTLAMSIVLLSYKYLRDRNLLRFLLIIFLGSLFHITALIFILAYPLAYLKVGIKQNLSILIALIIAYFLKDQVFKILSYLSDERYTYYIENGSGLSLAGFVIQLCIYIFCLYYKESVLNLDKKNLLLYNLLFLGLVFQAFAVVIAEFFRISMYFSIFSILLIPNVIQTIKESRLKILIYFLIISFLIVYIFWTGDFIGFKFLWQEG